MATRNVSAKYGFPSRLLCAVLQGLTTRPSLQPVRAFHAVFSAARVLGTAVLCRADLETEGISHRVYEDDEVLRKQLALHCLG